MTGELLPMREDDPDLVIRWWIALPCLLIDPISTCAVVALVLVVNWQRRPRPPRGWRA